MCSKGMVYLLKRKEILILTTKWMRLQSRLLSGTRQEENPPIKHLVQFIEMKGQWADITRPQGEWADVTTE